VSIIFSSLAFSFRGFKLCRVRRRKHQAKIAETPARAAMPMPTPTPIDAAVERVELDLDGVDVEVPDEVVVDPVEVTGVVDVMEDVVDGWEDEKGVL
jgi:hypothetical protein